MIISILLTHILLFLWGGLILRRFLPKEVPSLLLFVPCAYFIGEFFLIIWMYFLAFIHIGFSVLSIDLSLSVLIVLIAFISGGSKMGPLYFGHVEVFQEAGRFLKKIQKPVNPVNFIYVVLVLYVLGQVLFVSWMALKIPFFEWDVVWRIGLKGKVFFFDRSVRHLNDLPFPGYALGGPFLMSWWGWHIGVWSENIIRCITVAHFILFICLFKGFFDLFLKPAQSVAGLVLALSSGFFVYHATLLYNDFFVSVFLTASVFCIILAEKFKAGSFLFAASFLLALACFFKLESSVYVVLVSLITYFFVFRKHFEHELSALWYVLPVSGAVVLHTLLIWWLQLDTQQGVSFHLLPAAGIFSRFMATCSAILRETFLSWNWNITWVVLFFIAIARFGVLRKDGVLRLLLAFIATFFLYLVLVSTFTDRFRVIGGEESYQLLSRTVLHFYPLCPALAALLLFQRKDPV
jgi:hypothetical protein